MFFVKISHSTIVLQIYGSVKYQRVIILLTSNMHETLLECIKKYLTVVIVEDQTNSVQIPCYKGK